MLPASKAAKIAIDEVKKREGWIGTADMSQEGYTWYVIVLQKDGEHPTQRVVEVQIDGSSTGKVTGYRHLNESH
jgi:hypothetical protein